MASNDNVYGSLIPVKALPSEVLLSFLWFSSFVEFFCDSCSATEHLNF